jgi:ABC-type sugar transport system ATPase subunit
MAGLVGAGRTEVLEAIFGLDRQSTGELLVDGRRVDVRHPGEALSHDIGLVPEDRKRHGLILDMSVKENLSLPTLPRLSRLTWILGGAERRQARQYAERLRIRTPGLDTAVTTLSGGNQQKVVMARWLAAQSRILLLDEPTRGVDVGAKAELHSLIREWARGGHAVLFASSELPEILGLADRIVVMRNGRVAGELQADLASEESVLSLMAGVHAPAPA